MCVLYTRFSPHPGTLNSWRKDLLDLCVSLLLCIASKSQNRDQKVASNREAVRGGGWSVCMLVNSGWVGRGAGGEADVTEAVVDCGGSHEIFAPHSGAVAMFLQGW
jgi:hypothetical protein